MKNNLDLLFARLLSPSGLVKEGVCNAIANLIVNDQYNERVIKKLLNWVNDLKLESLTSYYLIPLIMAKYKSQDFSLPYEEKLRKNINKPSILSNIYLNSIYENNDYQLEYRSLHNNTYPADYNIDSFFNKYKRNFLPPIFTDRANTISKNCKVAFIKQWSCEWENIVELVNIKKTRSSFNYWGRKHDEHYAVFDTYMSEVYRSSYLRTLAWVVSQDNIHEDAMYYFSSNVIPIDFELWDLKSVAKPNWWPEIIISEKDIDTVPGQIWKSVEELWEEYQSSNKKNVLTHVSGRICQSENLVYDLEINSGFQRCRGLKIPDNKKLKSLFNDVAYDFDQINNLFFEGNVRNKNTNKLTKYINDWIIVPATGRIHPTLFPRWEYWKVVRDIWIPIPYKDLYLKCLSDKISIYDGNQNEEVAHWKIWSDSLKEKQIGNIPPSTGEILKVKNEYFKGLPSFEKYVFCWFCKITVWYRERKYEDWDTFSYFNTFGTTSIIF